MIIYFSGTGNSRCVAEILSQELGENALNATKLIKGKGEELNSNSPFIFVAPTYAWRLPKVFSKWLEKCTFTGSCKAYFVLTCGDSVGNAQKYNKKLCKKLSLKYLGTAEIVMPENYIALFSAPKKEEIPRIISLGEKKTLKAIEKIKSGELLQDKKIKLVDRLCSGIVNFLFYTFTVSARKFKATEKCISCEKCANLCPLNNIKLIDGKPRWGKTCTHCMACISYCPTLAIEYGRKTKNKDRYYFDNQK